MNRLGHMDMGARADADSEAGGASESQGQEATTTASIADSFDDPLGALTSQASAAAPHILHSKQTSNAFLLIMSHPPRCAVQPASHPLAPQSLRKVPKEGFDMVVRYPERAAGE